MTAVCSVDHKDIQTDIQRTTQYMDADATIANRQTDEQTVRQTEGLTWYIAVLVVH